MPPNISRRQFAKGAAAAFAAPMIVPASALGLDGNTAPSERINIASIGWGMMGPGNTNAFLSMDDVRVVAACDIDGEHLNAAVNRVNEHYGNEDCASYHSYEEMFDSEDLDAVMIAVPDHWHALIAVAAANKGLDIYGEKPLAHSFREQQLIVDAVNRNQRVWQTGSWQRSQFNFRHGCMLVRSGYIGRIHRIEVGLPSGHTDFAGTGDQRETTAVPEHLDYERWLGPAPGPDVLPYIPARVHMNWRWNYHFGGGQLLDWIGHHLDIAHWGMDWDHTGPISVEAEGDFPEPDALWNTATRYRVACKYPGNVEVVIAGGHGDIAGGTKFYGEAGQWIHVDRGRFDSNPESMSRMSNDEYNELPIQLYRSPGHQREFIDCVKSRTHPLAPVHAAHRSATPGHLAHVAMKLDKKIEWDPENEVITNDAEANALLTKDMREPYVLPGV